MDRFGTPREASATGPVPMPVLIMWGAEDKLIPVASAKWFAGQVPGAATIVYPGVGHLMMEEIPDRSAADLKAWLAKLPPPR
jgi:pimeloyl-ACP methyl ester carboxylesterase